MTVWVASYTNTREQREGGIEYSDSTGCLLLPRPILLQAAKRGKSPQQIAEEFQTSEPMARFRLNASGVLVQVGRAKAARNRQTS
jgi:hypothetical protein